MAIRKPKYKTLRELLAHELTMDEDLPTRELIRSLRDVRKVKFLTKDELLGICRWKSARAVPLCRSNHPATIRKLTREALTTRSERRKMEALTKLRGVGLPMASAILALVNPKRYGVIDIRVWQLLYAIKSVHSKPKGVGLTFKDWYQYLCKLRYHAKELGVPVRAIERTIFLHHQNLQVGTLYRGS